MNFHVSFGSQIIINEPKWSLNIMLFFYIPTQILNPFSLYLRASILEMLPNLLKTKVIKFIPSKIEVIQNRIFQQPVQKYIFNMILQFFFQINYEQLLAFTIKSKQQVTRTDLCFRSCIIKNGRLLIKMFPPNNVRPTWFN